MSLFYQVISPGSFEGTNFSFMTTTIRSSCISVLLFTQAGIAEGQMWDSVVVTVVTAEWPRPALHGPQLSWDGTQESWVFFWKTRNFFSFFLNFSK